jgi:hypothetical protein
MPDTIIWYSGSLSPEDIARWYHAKAFVKARFEAEEGE